MNDGPYKLHTGYLVEGLELYIRKVPYTKYDATVLVRWSNYIFRECQMRVYLFRLNIAHLDFN
jgi:hypothetical protein